MTQLNLPQELKVKFWQNLDFIRIRSVFFLYSFDINVFLSQETKKISNFAIHFLKLSKNLEYFGNQIIFVMFKNINISE